MPSPPRALPLRHRSYGLMCHSPLGSLLLRHLASFEESWQVVRSPCCPRELPDVISENLSLDAGSPTPAAYRVLSPVSSTVSSAFPTGKVGRLSASVLRITTSRRGVLEAADIPLCSGLQVCSPPRSFLPLRILPQSSRGFYVRAYRAPPHAPDMLTVRIQVIDGTGTCTLSDSQPCRLLLSRSPPIITDGQIPGSGLKPWHVFCGPSQRLERFKRWSVYTPAILVCLQPRLLTCLTLRRFYQAGRHTAKQAAKCPEPLCPTSV